MKVRVFFALFLCLLLVFPPAAASFSTPLGQLRGTCQPDGSAEITFTPEDPTLWYALSFEGTWHSAQNGVIEWTGLTAAAAYDMVSVPAGSDILPSDAPVCLSFCAPVVPPSDSEILREPDYEAQTDRLTLLSPNWEYEYALMAPDGSLCESGGFTWQSGGQPITYSGLDPAGEYRVLTRYFDLLGGMYCVSSDTLCPPCDDIVPAGHITASASEDNRGCITIQPARADFLYAVLTPQGTVVSAASPQDEKAVLSGLLPGFSYLVAALSPEQSVQPGQALPVRGTPVDVPAVSSDVAVTLCSEASGLQLCAAPACPDAWYTVTLPDGQPVPGLAAADASGSAAEENDGWFRSGNSLTFSGLKPDASYCLQMQGAFEPARCIVSFQTPSVSEFVQKSDALIGESSLSLSPEPGLSYAVYREDTGLSVSDWLSGEETLSWDNLPQDVPLALYVRRGTQLPLFCFSFICEKAVLPPSIPPASQNPAPEPADPQPEAQPAEGADVLLCTDRSIAYIEGNEDGLCCPDQVLTRAEMCVIFFRLLREVPADASCPYADVAPGAWYAPAVSALHTLGIVQGDETGAFRPDAPVTRAELAAMLSRFCTLSGEDISFSDLSKDHWAYAFAAAALQNGWLSMDESGAFLPNNGVCRGQAIHAVNCLLGRIPDPEQLEASSTRPAFPDLSPECPFYYDLWEASLGEAAR